MNVTKTKKIRTDINAETGVKTQMIISRTLALWELQRQGQLDNSPLTKQELAKLFGVSRSALDRSLAAVVAAQPEVDRMLRKIHPNYLAHKTEMVANARQLYAQKDVPGVWLDEDQYANALAAAGIEE